MRVVESFLCCTMMLWSISAHCVAVTKLTGGLSSADANGPSLNPSLSADGRYAVFESSASNLVANDLNNSSDIFLADTVNGTILRISETANGQEANGPSNNPSISANGRFIVFETFASNLVSNDTNRAVDILLYDRLSQTLERVSVASDNTEANSHSFYPSVSDNGQWITFYSMATNLAANDTNRAVDVFVRDRANGETLLVSADTNGNTGNMASWQPVISANGRFVAFSSSANNLVNGDTNNVQDVFVYDRNDGSIILVSRANDGTPGDGLSASPAINASGDFIAFESDATNLSANDTNNHSDIFVADLSQSLLTRVSVTTNGNNSDAPAYQPAISEDGRYVAYYSYASNIVTPDTNDVEDVFLYDQLTGGIELVTRTSSGEQANASSFTSAVNADGRYLVITTLASNLDGTDNNNAEDIYLFDRGIANTPPDANAGNDVNVVVGFAATLDASASSDPDGDAIVSYQWQMESAPVGSALINWSSTEVTPTFYPDVVGTYMVSLIVSDGVDQSPADEVFVNASENLPPTAVAAADITEGYAPLSISFDGSQSNDPEGATLAYNWVFGDGESSSEISPVHVFTMPGNYSVTLTVADPFGNTDQAIMQINVLSVNQSPVINDLTVNPQAGAAPLQVELSISAMDPDNDPLTINWDMGDGTMIQDTTNVVHIYNSAGTYTGSVTVDDGQSSVSESFVINVGSGFDIKKTYMDIYLHEEKPYRSKFKLRSHFELDTLPSLDDRVTLMVGKQEMLNLSLGHFRKVSAGIYLYRDKHAYAVLDLNRFKLEVSQRHVTAIDKYDEQTTVRIQIGAQTAMETVRLVKRSGCYRQRHRYGDYKSEDKDVAQCPVTVIKTAGNHRRRHRH
ncbi:MAG: PKD domain-containing protein [Gammaproteobacteria bacterium]